MTDDLVQRVARLYEDKWGVKDHGLARAAIAVALDAAAEVCERQATIAFEVDQCSHWEQERTLSLAAAIRAMIPKEPA